jgi:hypothetical protein
MTLEEQADAILWGTDHFVLLNNEIRAGVKEVLFLAAMGFEDDGTLPEGDPQAVPAIRPTSWPYIADQLEIGIAHAALSPALRDQWRAAVTAACRVADREFPRSRQGVDALIPF